MSTPHGTWSVETTNDASILVEFEGAITTQMGEDSVERLIELLGRGSAALIFHVVNVRGYDAGARQAWQTALWPRRDRIISIRIISNSALTRMGGRMFATFMRIPCTIEANGA